jgi:glycosyltransferase involved in cell wall biosynthesis
MPPLLAWSQDDILAHRSGYHVLADYLDASRIVTRRADPSGGVALLGTRLLRRTSFSRWFTGGSAQMEREIWTQCRSASTGPVHLLWCDRDLGFLDLLFPLLNQPLIGTFHQCPDDLPNVIRRPSTLKKFAAIILMSETQRGYFLDHGVPSQRLHRVLHGVDVDHFTPVTLDPPDEFKVLAVGGTRRDYRQMRAVAESFSGDRSLCFVVVAPADQTLPFFQDLPNVTCHARVSDAELLNLYRSSSCFLHLPENATANNAMLEAMACGAPVVSQRVGGVPEYVDDRCALLSAAGDVAGTVKAIRDLATSPSRQREMRHAARAHAQRHDWRLIAKETAEVYQQVA